MTAMTTVTWRCAVVVVSLVAFGAGCSSDDDPATSPDPTPADTTDSTVADSTVTDSTGTEPTGTESTGEVDGADALSTALDDLADSGFHFATVVTAGGGLAIQAEGERIGEGTRFVVLRDEARVDYVATADGTWVKPADGVWSAVASPPTAADPVPALASATSVTLESSEGSTITLLATVPLTALGYEGEDTSDVTVTLTDGAIVEVRYDSTVQGLAASVVTTVSAVQDDTPIVAPI
jgi:hypothetical protein